MGFFGDFLDAAKTQPPLFNNGDIAHLKINPEIRGQVRLKAVAHGFGGVSWDYELRRDDGTLLTGLRAFELELDK